MDEPKKRDSAVMLPAWNEGTEPHQFTCTLGHALKWKEAEAKESRSFETILSLIDEQAQDLPDTPCLGFASLGPEDTKGGCFVTFSQLREKSIQATAMLSEVLPVPLLRRTNPTIALLADSSVDFILTWLGILRLGCRPFLLAPQLGLPAIDSLCAGSDCHVILVDHKHKAQLPELMDAIDIVEIPRYSRQLSNVRFFGLPDICSSDLAFIQHSSGTSSGVPKPISTTHWGAVGALPRLRPKHPTATFSTTPLYHGGLADCLRAWTSGSMMWFFPEGVAPITGSNIIAAVKSARSRTDLSVVNFSSVPFVLQLLADTEEGIELLRSMDIVGVGGAALPDAVGDRLVKLGVRLISRMGSAECGFLMSSERDFEQDKDWQYLRPVVDAELLSFEEQPESGGLCELVVRPKWPLMAKTNRDDGSFATADLFEPHPSIANAWRYHSRSDSQIALASGKKFDPAPLEGVILAASDCLTDVLVFGAGRDEPGALLLVKDSAKVSDEGIIEKIWPSVEEMNRKMSSHSRISRPMLVIKRVGEHEKPLEKSSKWTIMRHRAEARYAEAIEEAYDRVPIGSLSIYEAIPDQDVGKVVAESFHRVLGRHIDPARDVYSQGVDSIACTRIRKMLQSALLPAGAVIPLNAIYDRGTIEKLTRYILRLRAGDDSAKQNGEQPTLAEMRNLVEKFGTFDPSDVAPAKENRGNVVVLTGATGSLGAHILHLLLQDPNVTKVFCLVRAESSSVARERVSKALLERGMPALDSPEDGSLNGSKAVCVPCVLSEKDLGLSTDARQDIIQQANIFIHSAWSVNFSLSLRSFEDHIAGTRYLLDLARRSGASFNMISSTASIAQSLETIVPETMSADPHDAAPLGYAQSKWVGEQICAAASKCNPGASAGEESGFPEVAVIRVGQLCGNKDGIWSASEAYPLVLSSSKMTGCLPDFGDEPLDWLPVDQAAQAVLEIALASSRSCESRTMKKGRLSMSISHVLNPHRTPTWRALLNWVGEDQATSLKIVRPDEWISRLEDELTKTKNQSHPAQGLLSFWKQKYANPEDESSQRPMREGPGAPSFSIKDTREASPTMGNVQPLERTRILRMLRWIQKQN